MVVLGGIEYDVVFASEVSDNQRIELGLPARGTGCSCDECACDNQADAGTIERPMCGCCLADCPDVHPEGETDGPHEPQPAPDRPIGPARVTIRHSREAVRIAPLAQRRVIGKNVWMGS